MAKPPVLIITGYGLNCEAESRYAWELAGAKVTLMHLNDLLADPKQLHNYYGLMFIGGFSYGDHMTSGHVLAQRIRHRLQEHLTRYIWDGKLIMGVCNGFQVMIKMGLLPGIDGSYFKQSMALMQNDCGHFQNYWINLKFDQESPCVFTRGLDKMTLPIRHGEGKLYTLDKSLLTALDESHCVPCHYIDPETSEPTMKYPHNPNGSLNAMAAMCDSTGHIFGLMPHPEAYLFPQNHPHWDLQKLQGKLPPAGFGLLLFRNAINYLTRD